jgi:flagellar protein FliO/FliZ
MRAVDEAGVRFARPRSLTWTLRALAAAAILVLLEPTIAVGATFKRDRTPLPSSLSGTGSTADTSSSSSGFGRLAIGLVLVLALIFAIRWIVRRAGGPKLPGSTGKLSVVATAPLGPNRAVHLVRVGPELVLVGSSEQRVNALRVYDAEETAELTALLDPDTQFASLAPAVGTGAAGTTGRTGFMDELRKRTARR